MIFRAKIKIYTKSKILDFIEETIINNKKSEKENAREIFKEAKNFYENLYPDAKTIEYEIEKLQNGRFKMEDSRKIQKEEKYCYGSLFPHDRKFGFKIERS